MKIWMRGMVGAMAVAGVVVSFYFQHRLLLGLRRENQSLREQIDRVAAANRSPSRQAAPSGDPPSLSDEHFRELLKLRGEVTNLRRQQDDLLRQLAAKTTPPPSPLAEADETWVRQLLNGVPKAQGVAAGNLRGKLLRREMAKISPAELALQQELLKRQLNQTLEREPALFADFQAGFIGSALGIADETRVEEIRGIIHKTYEYAVANGLDIPSKPATGTDEWVQRRFQLDRAATAQLNQLFTDDERHLFDRAFLGVMGVDLGGVGVDKSNYPRGFLGPE